MTTYTMSSTTTSSYTSGCGQWKMAESTCRAPFGGVAAGVVAALWPGTGVGDGGGVATTVGTGAPGASGVSCGGAGTEESTSVHTRAAADGGSRATTTVSGLVGANPIASTFLVVCGRPVSAAANV